MSSPSSSAVAFNFRVGNSESLSESYRLERHADSSKEPGVFQAEEVCEACKACPVISYAVALDILSTLREGRGSFGIGERFV